jgi:hypothetical protein
MESSEHYIQQNNVSRYQKRKLGGFTPHFLRKAS